MQPRDSELARRAAGGDGTAFVRLYDRYSADVFEDALGKTRSVELAADATQTAFLNLLRRPPAMDAPDRDVIDRLRAMAVAANGEWRPPATGTGVGWLRSETVAKAGARFDADWSRHLAGAEMRKRTLAEVALAWQATEAPAEAVPPVRPAAEPADSTEPAVRRRRFRLRTFLAARPAFALPGLRTGLPAAGAAAAALVLFAAAGDDGPPGDRSGETALNLDAARLAPLGVIADRLERPAPPRKRRPASGADGEAVAVAYRPGTTPARGAEDLAVVPARRLPQSTGGRGETPGRGGPTAAETLGVTQEVTAPRGTGRVRTHAKVPKPAPQRPPAASQPPPADASPAPTQPAPAQPAPGPAEPRSTDRAPTSPNGGGVLRNCNSKQSLNPC